VIIECVKLCPKCNNLKNVDKFHKSAKSVDGCAGYCKVCARNYLKKYIYDNKDKVNENWNKWHKSRPDLGKNRQLKKSFSITRDEYELMVAYNDEKCHICSKKEVVVGRNGKIKELAVDHIKGTTKIRGLLCQKCNQAIGLFKENVDALFIAIAYIKHEGFMHEFINWYKQNIE
jgi:hypothetical protein